MQVPRSTKKEVYDSYKGSVFLVDVDEKGLLAPLIESENGGFMGLFFIKAMPVLAACVRQYHKLEDMMECSNAKFLKGSRYEIKKIKNCLETNRKFSCCRKHGLINCCS